MHPQFTCVKLLVDKIDTYSPIGSKRIAPAGSEGTIVDVYDVIPVGYCVEIPLNDANGRQRDLYLVDVTHDEIEIT